MGAPELEEKESRWEMARSGLLALAELVIITVFTLLYIFAPALRHLLIAVAVFLLIALFLGSPSDPLWWVAAAITSLAVILFCVRKFMQG